MVIIGKPLPLSLAEMSPEPYAVNPPNSPLKLRGLGNFVCIHPMELASLPNGR